MNSDFLISEAIKILPSSEVKRISNFTYMFTEQNETYAVRFRNSDTYVLVDFAIIKNNMPHFFTERGFKTVMGVWSKVLTCLYEYIKENNPTTIKMLTTDKDLIEFYNKMLPSIRKFKEFKNFDYDKEVTKDGTLYILTKDLTQIDEMIGKYLNEI